MASPDKLDHVPLIQRRRSLLARNADVTADERNIKREISEASQEWQGLPRGLRFDPTDGDLLHNLIAKIRRKNGDKTTLQHPIINKFIKSLDLDQGFDLHPHNLPGVKQDGSISYFFHKPLIENSASCQNPIGWIKTGKSTRVYLDGTHQGFKEVYHFFRDRSEKTNWVLHQYRAGTEREGEIAVSKLSYCIKSNENFSLKNSGANETCTNSKESEKNEDSNSNQGQNGNFGGKFKPKSPQNHRENELQLVQIKTEPVSEPPTALKTVQNSDSSALNACLLKSENLLLKIRENEIQENEIPESQIPSSFEGSEKVIKAKKPRKRKKTATDSVEQALEEDAPGLLKVLTEKGIIMGEIKLYEVGESDTEAMEISSENDFQTLENVITKIFPDRVSLLKIANAKNVKASKALYCVACLISLIEQTRYLQFNKSPVEWGWCRDLQSFIFVFETHNRIVLERPEYGYATYFFELIKSVPLDWQIKRLITAMKVNTSRASLIENKPLLVGTDLTESEAQTLESYGWVSQTGLGTMLNYCDRVVHDRWRQSERDSSEWRAKISRILMNGFNGGAVEVSQVPIRVQGYLCKDAKIEGLV